MKNTETTNGGFNPISTKDNNLMYSLYDKVFDRIPEPSFLLEDDRILRCNQALVELFGYSSKDELLSRRLYHLFPIEQPDGADSKSTSLEHIFTALEQGVTSFEWTHVKKNGEPLYTRVILLNLQIEERNIIHVILHDNSKEKILEYQLKESEEKFRNLFEGNTSVMLIIDPETGRIIEANPRACEYYRYTRDELLTQNIYDINQLPKELVRREMELARTEKRNYFNFQHRLSNGEIRDVEVYSGAITIQDREVLCSIIHDVSEKTRLIEQNSLFDEIYNHNTESIMVLSRDWKIKWVNEALIQLCGYSREELIGSSPHFLTPSNSGGFDINSYESFASSLIENRTWQGEVSLKSKGEKEIPSAISITKITKEDGNLYYMLTFMDITEHKRNLEKIDFLAFRDPLTGLYNKNFFMERLKYELNKSWSRQDIISVMFIDIEQFSRINNQYGHSMGEKVLKRIAEDLNKVFLECDTIARYGADEFIILLPYVETQEDLEAMAELVIKRIQYFCGRIDNKNVRIKVNIGITLEKKMNITAEEIINQAHIALMEAKNDKNSWYRFFSPQLKDRIHSTYLIENALSQALENNELFMLYQPIFEMEYGGLVGAEALIRWNHPKLGVLSPNEFIPIAEENGLILEIGEWVIKTACEFIKRLQNSQKVMIPISVNVSSIQLEHDQFIRRVRKIIEGVRINPSYLELEITETTAMQDVEKIGAKLSQLKELGVKIAIDDFGTGYSSLSQLQNLKVDKLKIDRSFVKNINIDPSSKNITQAIINIANTFNLTTVAEGIETVEQLNALKELRSNMFQGFLYCKPITEEYLVHFIEEQE